jgi:hypothetical protein
VVQDLEVQRGRHRSNRFTVKDPILESPLAELQGPGNRSGYFDFRAQSNSPVNDGSYVGSDHSGAEHFLIHRHQTQTIVMSTLV